MQGNHSRSSESQPSADSALVEALLQSRVIIEEVEPRVGCGRHAARAVVGRPLEVSATLIADGIEHIAARLLWRHCDEPRWQSTVMTEQGNDRWRAALTPGTLGAHEFTIEARLDHWSTWCHGLAARHQAGQPVELEVVEGRQRIASAMVAARGRQREALEHLDQQLSGAMATERAVALLLAPSTERLMTPLCLDASPATLPRPLPLWVDREAAVHASWYELFPRSQSSRPGQHGTFDDVIARLPAIHAMGFDVLYLPPIHPIGHSDRKGPNNALVAAPGDPGSPYAIGSEEGGHTAIHPELGSLEDFHRLVAAAGDYDMEIALDLAIQCSPDHPWLHRHPRWFRWRPDGSLRHAENPPKQYEDIVNLDFYPGDHAPELWRALRDIVRFWIDQGVHIFRVDNPHTKPLPFWRWLIADIRQSHPEVLFLSEAFTRPAMMYQLAMLGFTQSYTYFTWRNSRQELIDYMMELTRGSPRKFFRPHFFVNTPDINPWFLQRSGRPGFLIRAALAATLSGLWGLYSGFELCESEALPGREEYLDSEKYQLRQRDWQAPGNIIREIARLNHLRRRYPALQDHLNLEFHPVWNDQVLYFGKPNGEGDLVLVAISLDPHQPQGAHFALPLEQLGATEDTPLQAVELMQQQELVWQGRVQHWYFDPAQLPFAIWHVRPPTRPS